MHNLFQRIFLQVPLILKIFKKILIKNQGHTTTLGALFSTLCKKCMGSLVSPGNQYRKDTQRRQGQWLIELIQEELKI